MSVFIKETSDYFTLLSEQHVEVKHGEKNRAFCRFQDMEQFNQLRNHAAKNIVLVKSFFGAASGEFDDSETYNVMVLCFSAYAKTVSSAEIVVASEKAFRIMMDFWVRMRIDFEENNCAWLKDVDFEKIRYDEIEQPWLQNHYGWDLVIPYKSRLPAFDFARWGGVDIGGQPVQVSSLRRLLRFRVGEPGAPMNHEDTDLYSGLFEDVKLLVMVDGVTLPVDEGTGDISWVGLVARRCEHFNGSTLLRFVGGVVYNEIIEIYEIQSWP